ncbi:MAG: class I SAM-dependent methyltransferase [Candidatus Diapherotrites archaeon]
MGFRFIRERLRAFRKNDKLIPSNGRTFEEYLRGLHLTQDQIIGKRVMDLGSGLSDFAAHCNKLGGNTRAVAIDPKHFLDAKESEAVKARGKRFVVARTPELPFKKNSFDLVVSQHFLEHVKDPFVMRVIIVDVLRVLRRNGEVRFLQADFDYFHLYKYIKPWLDRNGFHVKESPYVSIKKTGRMEKLVASIEEM